MKRVMSLALLFFVHHFYNIIWERIVKIAILIIWIHYILMVPQY
jgi:hypothetical protein